MRLPALCMQGYGLAGKFCGLCRVTAGRGRKTQQKWEVLQAVPVRSRQESQNFPLSLSMNGELAQQAVARHKPPSARTG